MIWLVSGLLRDWSRNMREFAMGKLRWFSTRFIRMTGCVSMLFADRPSRTSERHTGILPPGGFGKITSPMRINRCLGHAWFKDLRIGIDKED